MSNAGANILLAEGKYGNAYKGFYQDRSKKA